MLFVCIYIHTFQSFNRMYIEMESGFDVLNFPLLFFKFPFWL